MGEGSLKDQRQRTTYPVVLKRKMADLQDVSKKGPFLFLVYVCSRNQILLLCMSFCISPLHLANQIISIQNALPLKFKGKKMRART